MMLGLGLSGRDPALHLLGSISLLSLGLGLSQASGMCFWLVLGLVSVLGLLKIN